MRTLDELFDARSVMHQIKVDPKPLMLQLSLVAACGWHLLTPKARKALGSIVAYGQGTLDLEAMAEDLEEAKVESESLGHTLNAQCGKGHGGPSPHEWSVDAACEAVVEVGTLVTRANYEAARNVQHKSRHFNAIPALVILNRYHGHSV